MEPEPQRLPFPAIWFLSTGLWGMQVSDTFKQRLAGPDTFDQKLRAGLQGEEIARVYLESLGYTVLRYDITPGRPIEKLRAGDLLVSGKPVEVKTDIYAAKSDRLALEHQSFLTHTAPTIVFMVPTFYWISRTKGQLLIDTWPTKGRAGDDLRDHTFVERHSQEVCPTCKRQLDSEIFRENFTEL